MIEATSIMDLQPSRIWQDRIEAAGSAHGSELMTFFSEMTCISDSEKAADDVIRRLILNGRITKDKKPSPTESQRFYGAGGILKVKGQAAPLVCWRYFRGSR